jgi:phytoene dehydrogenase-like protein
VPHSLGVSSGRSAFAFDALPVRSAQELAHQPRMPQRPLLLVAQQYLADPKRSSGDVHPVWAYARAPNGYGGDAERTLTDQIESFAPGFRERIVAKPVTSTNEIAVTATRTTSGGTSSTQTRSPGRPGVASGANTRSRS